MLTISITISIRTLFSLRKLKKLVRFIKSFYVTFVGLRQEFDEFVHHSGQANPDFNSYMGKNLFIYKGFQVAQETSSLNKII